MPMKSPRVTLLSALLLASACGEPTFSGPQRNGTDATKADPTVTVKSGASTIPTEGRAEDVVPPLETGNSPPPGQQATGPGTSTNPNQTMNPPANPGPNTPANPGPNTMPMTPATGAKILVVDLKGTSWLAPPDAMAQGMGLLGEAAKVASLTVLHVSARQARYLSAAPSGRPEPLFPCIPAGAAEATRATADCAFGSLEGFNQVWVFSGSTSHPLDVPATSAVFRSLDTRLAALRQARPEVGLFIVSGLGNIAHANGLIQGTLALTNSPAFAVNPVAPTGSVPFLDFGTRFPMQGLTADAAAGAGTFKKTGTLLDALDSVPDFTRVEHLEPRFSSELGDCLTDPLLTAAESILARDRCGQPTLALLPKGAPTAGHTLLDGNGSRYFGTGGKELLGQLARVLSK